MEIVQKMAHKVGDKITFTGFNMKSRKKEKINGTVVKKGKVLMATGTGKNGTKVFKILGRA